MRNAGQWSAMGSRDFVSPRGSYSPRGFVSLCALAGVIFGLAPSAHAYVPRANRVIDAVAGANVKGHRVRALRFTLNLRIGDGPPVAVGELVTHPTGLARLELRASGGLVERHILLGDHHSAARNARLLVRPRAFLPPLFVLQSNSGVVLEAALGTLGVDRGLVGIAPCGDNDCFVIGDPTRTVRHSVASTPAETKAKVKAGDPGDETSEDIAMSQTAVVRAAESAQVVEHRRAGQATGSLRGRGRDRSQRPRGRVHQDLADGARQRGPSKGRWNCFYYGSNAVGFEWRAGGPPERVHGRLRLPRPPYPVAGCGRTPPVAMRASFRRSLRCKTLLY
ncbi:MAG: hypothetical protein JRG89_25145 [Deltaproteobacteria bacterium]|nr:hypothetical protein [Deltaproteobacteria bacterium]